MILRIHYRTFRKHKAYFNMTLSTPANKTIVYNVMEGWWTCVCFTFWIQKQKCSAIWKDFNCSRSISRSLCLPIYNFIQRISPWGSCSGNSDDWVWLCWWCHKDGNYKRGMQIHKLIYKPLVRILTEQGESNGLPRSIKAKLQNSFGLRKYLMMMKNHISKILIWGHQWHHFGCRI